LITGRYDKLDEEEKRQRKAERSTRKMNMIKSNSMKKEKRKSQNKVTFICDLYDGKLNSSLFLFLLVVLDYSSDQRPADGVDTRGL
jgi:hypothetical protein